MQINTNSNGQLVYKAVNDSTKFFVAVIKSNCQWTLFITMTNQINLTQLPGQEEGQMYYGVAKRHI